MKHGLSSRAELGSCKTCMLRVKQPTLLVRTHATALSQHELLSHVAWPEACKGADIQGHH